MARSSILGADRAATQAKGRDVGSLGPSDSSDSGSDVQGEIEVASPEDLDRTVGATQPGVESDSDSGGTGERGAASIEDEVREGDDILPDRVGRFSQSDSDGADVTDEVPELAEDDDRPDIAIEREEDEDTTP